MNDRHNGLRDGSGKGGEIRGVANGPGISANVVARGTYARLTRVTRNDEPGAARYHGTPVCSLLWLSYVFTSGSSSPLNVPLRREKGNNGQRSKVASVCNARPHRLTPNVSPARLDYLGLPRAYVQRIPFLSFCYTRRQGTPGTRLPAEQGTVPRENRRETAWMGREEETNGMRKEKREPGRIAE